MITLVVGILDWNLYTTLDLTRILHYTICVCLKKMSRFFASRGNLDWRNSTFLLRSLVPEQDQMLGDRVIDRVEKFTGKHYFW